MSQICKRKLHDLTKFEFASDAFIRFVRYANIVFSSILLLEKSVFSKVLRKCDLRPPPPDRTGIGW